MEMNEYQERSKETLQRECNNIEYLTLGLNGEAGEVADKIKRIIRKDATRVNLSPAIAEELGDVLWYVSSLAALFGYSLETIAERNLHKLHNRKIKGTLKGSGDDR